mgnify:CR=1 FL=1
MIYLAGSSPHTRGARDDMVGDEPGHRIIPAYAGSTSHAIFRADAAADHPRIRGEHQPRHHQPRGSCGSSPHTRGAHRLRALPGRQLGIIPAYAGSTPGRSNRDDTCRDHPRIRGEHVWLWSPRKLSLGSSPHTRGALPSWRRARRLTRIIPAYAGSTFRRIRGSAPGTDHPRIRGEHKHGFPALWISDGSSPHTRGALGY